MRGQYRGCNLGAMKSFAERLIRARKRAGLNQTELARQVGVTPQAVQKWETGENTPRGKRIQAIADILDISVQELISGDDPFWNSLVPRKPKKPVEEHTSLTLRSTGIQDSPGEYESNSRLDLFRKLNENAHLLADEDLKMLVRISEKIIK